MGSLNGGGLGINISTGTDPEIDQIMRGVRSYGASGKRGVTVVS